ncbi:hypothetical protein HRJ34_04310 [Rhizorhabdus wittichii]|uniref:Uncharacterized protein n=1 Tax=Rhizorhabdus wittichii TaxID=160791 RepID=A0A975HEX0_9SPHN|nr:hypothetical protein [Rhizorhabdus wittichii]QTH22753.1 hypothetical protein HRJ34_04310 [Rhizorhabdus wittichii]
MTAVSIILLHAMALTSTVATPSECERSIAKLATAAAPATRIVATFTGTQRSLLPLDEASSSQAEAGRPIEPTLFPIGADSFVLTIQFRPQNWGTSQSAAFAESICSVGLSGGGRFNGVMSFVGGRMTDAEFARIPER